LHGPDLLVTAHNRTHSALHSTHSMVLVGLLAGIQARTERPEYARLLSDCQILYCDTRLQLVSGVTHDAILHMSSQTLPVLARDGWGYLMQVRPGCMHDTSLWCVPDETPPKSWQEHDEMNLGFCRMRTVNH
jgi:hypothetical protein